MLRRVEIQTDYRFEFFGELRIVAELECLHQMRLEAVRMPDAPDAGLADSHRRRHGPRAPMSGIGWLVLSGLLDHLLNEGGVDGGLSSGAGCILEQTGHARLQETIAPASCFLWRNLQPGGDLFVLLAGGSH